MFIDKDGSPLTKFQFAAIFCKAILIIGVWAECFAPYPFGIGEAAATAVAAAGWPSVDIHSIGRWWSEAFKNYVKPLAILARYSDPLQSGKLKQLCNVF